MSHDKILDSLHVSRTYGGSYAGRVESKVMIEAARKSVERLFGPDRPTLVLPPKTQGDALPEWQYVAWFSCYTPVENEDACGSHLFVVWWDDVLCLDPSSILDKVYWKKHAKDFDF